MTRSGLVFNLLVFAILAVQGQDTVQFNIGDDKGLVDYSKNVINHPAGLSTFFQKLLQLKIEKKGQINILHIGDSHIQADYQTQQLRQNFQNEFGNGGRGFLIPAKVAQNK